MWLIMFDHFGKVIRAGWQAHPTRVLTELAFQRFDRVAEEGASRVIGQEPVHTDYHALGPSDQTQQTPASTRTQWQFQILTGPRPRGWPRVYPPNEGASPFQLIFPADRHVKPGIGINTYSSRPENLTSYAKLPDDEIAARVPCDLKDHPFLLIPIDQRKSFLEKFLGAEQGRQVYERLPQYLARGDLCHRCRQIYDALLISHQGDARKVLQNIQVERLYFSRRYRRGLVTIEPQLHVDAQYQLLTYNKSVSALPSALQNINLFTLTGDLIEEIAESSNFQISKKPIDTFKYLLIADRGGQCRASIAYPSRSSGLDQ